MIHAGDEKTNLKKILVTTGVFATAGVVYLGYFSYITYTNLEQAKQNLTETITKSQEALKLAEENNTALSDELTEVKSFLTDEQKKNIDLEKEKTKNEKEIDKLEKLTTIDPELLRKYSKVFFLSENYTPPKLRDIDAKFRINSNKEIQILREVEPFLNDLLEDADDDGVNLRVISGYRSFETQQQLKTNYVTTYGTGANQFSADQGYSEHQLGTTVDFGTPEVTGAYLSFQNTEAFDWLTENAHKYGFIMSYPSGNSYYQYEPWHWRFVGQDLADDLHDNKKSFYELDQRDINDYLIKIFD